MKSKIMIIAMMILLTGTLAQAQIIPYMTSGRLLNEDAAHKGYHLTPNDISEALGIAIDSLDFTTTKWYTLKSGVKIQILHPIQWAVWVLASYEANDTSVNVNNIVEIIKKDTVIKWTSSMKPVRNYYWSYYGKPAYIDNYNGAALDVDVIVHKGNPTVKCSCANPVITCTEADRVLALIGGTIPPHINMANNKNNNTSDTLTVQNIVPLSHPSLITTLDESYSSALITKLQ